MSSTAEKSCAEIEEVEWHWLRLHLERGAVIVVASPLELASVAASLAADDTVAVGAWIAGGELAKPTLAQVEAWNADPARRFRMLIVQPWVLIQATERKD